MKPIDYTLSKTLGLAFDVPLFAQHYICRPCLPQELGNLKPTTISNVEVVFLIVYVPIIQDYHVLVLSHVLVMDIGTLPYISSLKY